MLVVNHGQNDSHLLEAQVWLTVVEVIFKGGSNPVEENCGGIGVGLEDGVEELES